MKEQKIVKTKIIWIIFLTLALAVSALGLFSVSKAKGSQAITPELVLPSSNLEYQELNNPIDAYQDNNVTAILVKNHKSLSQNYYLYLYKDGAYNYINTDSSNNALPLLQQVKPYGNSLLISSYNSLYKVDYSQDIQINKLLDNTNANVNANFFDLNSKYLVTASSSGSIIYKIENGQIIKYKTDFIDNINAYNFPIAVNESDYIFYVYNNILYKSQINENPKASSEYIKDVAPSSMIANNEYVYYIYNNKIYRISVNGGDPQELSCPQTDFKLGSLNIPINLSFKGENLLITGDNAVQEFRITQDNKLEFTGFAISKNNSAYNRIDGSVKEIERQKDTLATLDDNYLTLINIAGNFDAYNKDNFSHYSSIKYNNKMPDTFALGENSALFLYDKGKDVSPLAIYDFKTQQFNTNITLNNKITDIAYQSGKYYVLSHKDINNTTEIYVSAENQVDFQPLQINIKDVNASIMEIDVFGNVFLYCNDGKVYKYDNIAKDTQLIGTLTNVIKLETDLGGNLFALDSDNKIHSYIDGAWQTPIEIASNLSNARLKSFTVDFDKKQVYIVYDSEELVVKTSALPNLAIDDLDIQEGSFKITDTTATDSLKAYSAKQGANVYSVNKTSTDKFEFNELIKQAEGQTVNYAFVTEITKGNVSLYALVGQNHTVLINSLDVEEVSINKTLAPQSAYITTSVNGYYLPIITANGEYSLTDVETVRLLKSQEIKPKHKISFLDKEYYFADFTIGEKSYSGYVPVDYTITVLSQDFKWNNYTIEKVSNATVYLEKELSTQLIQLEKGQSVRVLDNDGEIAHVAYLYENQWLEGYIDASNILDESKSAIINILIIIAVMASVCGTTTFFLLRRKK